MALLDTVREKLKSPSANQAPAAGTGMGQTGTIRDLLRGKTGKAAAPSSGPRQSSIQEKMAQQQTNIGMDQLGQKGQIQAEQFQQREMDIDQRTQQQTRLSEEKFKDLRANAQRQTAEILDQFNRGQKSLQSQEDIADLEQAGFQIRLDNDKYVSRLQQEGQRSRLDDKLAFKKQLAQDIFKDNNAILNNEITFNRIMDADKREFTDELAAMDINSAIDMANSEIQAATSRQMFEGGATAATAGAKGYEKWEKEKPKPKPKPEGG